MHVIIRSFKIYFCYWKYIQYSCYNSDKFIAEVHEQ